MDEQICKIAGIPAGMPINHRAKPRPTVEVPGGEVPLMDHKTPKDKQIQEYWVSRSRVFNLADETHLDDYTAAWQKITDGHAVLGTEEINYNEEAATYIILLRWAEFDYKLPETS